MCRRLADLRWRRLRLAPTRDPRSSTLARERLWVATTRRRQTKSAPIGCRELACHCWLQAFGKLQALQDLCGRLPLSAKKSLQYHIFETATVGFEGEVLRIDDLIETQNHFRAVDYVIDNAAEPLCEEMLKELHRILKSSTTDAARSWFAVGEYKKLENEAAGRATSHPEDVARDIQNLLASYDSKRAHTLEEILDFHVAFERIHPFQDGNGRVGRLVMFKECLASGVVPFIIEDEMKAFYYRGLSEWDRERGFLTDTCLTAQDRFKAALDYFRIAY